MMLKAMLLSLLLSAASAFASVGDVQILQTPPSNGVAQPVILSLPADNESVLFFLNGVTGKPAYLRFGTGLSLSGGYVNVSAAQVDWTQTSTTATDYIKNKPTTVAGYGIVDALTSGAAAAAYQPKFTGSTAQYVRGDGSVLIFPTIPAAVALTTTGSGAATFNPVTGALNIPTPAAGTRTVTHPARTIGAAYQISTTQDARVSYSIGVEVAALASLSTVKSTGVLEYADNAAMTTNVQQVDTGRSGAGGVLLLANSGTIKLVGDVPAGKWARIRVTNAGSPTVTLDAVQEVLQ